VVRCRLSFIVANKDRHSSINHHQSTDHDLSEHDRPLYRVVSMDLWSDPSASTGTTPLGTDIRASQTSIDKSIHSSDDDGSLNSGNISGSISGSSINSSNTSNATPRDGQDRVHESFTAVTPRLLAHRFLSGKDNEVSGSWWSSLADNTDRTLDSVRTNKDRETSYSLSDGLAQIFVMKKSQLIARSNSQPSTTAAHSYYQFLQPSIRFQLLSFGGYPSSPHDPSSGGESRCLVAYWLDPREIDEDRRQLQLQQYRIHFSIYLLSWPQRPAHSAAQKPSEPIQFHVDYPMQRFSATTAVMVDTILDRVLVSTWRLKFAVLCFSFYIYIYICCR
jgi:hypothetical protein